MEFTGEVKIKAPSTCWISIPLSPLGINHPPRFQAKVEVKWFDENRYRIGGIFSGLEKNDEQILEQVIEKLSERGLAKPLMILKKRPIF